LAGKGVDGKILGRVWREHVWSEGLATKSALWLLGGDEWNMHRFIREILEIGRRIAGSRSVAPSPARTCLF
jgi:hypothetical protein